MAICCHIEPEVMAIAFSTLFQSGLDWVLGSGCAACGQAPAPQGWCPRHWGELEEQQSARLRCRQCGLPGGSEAALHQARVCSDCLSRPQGHVATYVGADYQAPWDETVRALKFSGKIEKARALAYLLDRALPAGLTLDLLVPVPAWPGRLAQRGFNAPALIAAKLAQRRGWRFDALALAMQRELPEIHGLKARQRRQAVQGAFVPLRPLAGLRVGLMDDVMTTGATLEAAGAAVRAAGARQLVLLAVLRTPREF
jgi:ComF family protein